MSGTTIRLKDGHSYDLEDGYAMTMTRINDGHVSDSSMLVFTRAYARGEQVAIRRDAIAAVEEHT